MCDISLHVTLGLNSYQIDITLLIVKKSLHGNREFLVKHF